MMYYFRNCEHWVGQGWRFVWEGAEEGRDMGHQENLSSDSGLADATKPVEKETFYLFGRDDDGAKCQDNNLNGNFESRTFFFPPSLSPQAF